MGAGGKRTAHFVERGMAKSHLINSVGSHVMPAVGVRALTWPVRPNVLKAPETVDEAKHLRKELLTFTRWIAPGKTLKQITAKEQSLKNRPVDFLYTEQPYWT